MTRVSLWRDPALAGPAALLAAIVLLVLSWIVVPIVVWQAIRA